MSKKSVAEWLSEIEYTEFKAKKVLKEALEMLEAVIEEVPKEDDHKKKNLWGRFSEDRWDEHSIDDFEHLVVSVREVNSRVCDMNEPQHKVFRAACDKLGDTLDILRNELKDRWEKEDVRIGKIAKSFWHM